MQARLLAFLLCAGFIIGCVHTHEVGYHWSQTPPERMLESLTGKDVTVTMKDSTQYGGSLVAEISDTLHLRGGGVDTSMHLPLNKITSIYAGGSLWGPIVGILGGGLAGGLIGGAIGKSGPGSDGLGAIDETFGALIGGLAGAAAGALVGGNATAANRYTLPSGGIQSRKSADTVTVQVEKILDETEFSVTIPWYSGRTTLPKSRISIEKRAGGIYIKVPRWLLYQDRQPRYIDADER